MLCILLLSCVYLTTALSTPPSDSFATAPQTLYREAEDQDNGPVVPLPPTTPPPKAPPEIVPDDEDLIDDIEYNTQQSELPLPSAVVSGPSILPLVTTLVCILVGLVLCTLCVWISGGGREINRMMMTKREKFIAKAK